MSPRAFLAALALIGTYAVTACASTALAVWQPLKLGEFSLSVPASMTHKMGGIDSQAGTLEDSAHRISYDYGAYSDSLKSVEGASNMSERAGKVDGLSARFVSYSRVNANRQTQTCEGVHVPFVRKSAIGSIKLTLLLCGDAKTASATADKIFSSIKFHPEPVR